MSDEITPWQMKVAAHIAQIELDLTNMKYERMTFWYHIGQALKAVLKGLHEQKTRQK